MMVKRGLHIPWKNYIVVTMLFSWDPEKAAQNLSKHRISFELAQSIFDDSLQVSLLDSKKHSEARWVTMGCSANGMPLVVVHTYHVDADHNEIIRIISARKATPKEVKAYEEGI